jgi:hypothetical protein
MKNNVKEILEQFKYGNRSIYESVDDIIELFKEEITCFENWLFRNNYTKIGESDFFDENFVTFKESELLKLYKENHE